MSEAVAKQINKLIDQLRTERKVHADAIAEIDEAFESLGLSPGAVSSAPATAAANATPSTPAKRGPGRPKKTAKKVGKKSGRRGRGGGGQTAQDFILSLLEGGKTLISSEINKAWKSAGRKGVPHNTLSAMTKDGTIKRENIPGQRGSRYSKA